MIKCSIICTSHDRPKFLKEAIDSVFAQSIPEWQLIIVDSSTDPQVKTILDEAKKDERVLVLTEPRNVGVDNLGNIAQAWNRALDRVEGKYISFLDDDNRKKPEFCEKLSDFLSIHPEFDAACCFSECIDQDGNIQPPRRYPLGMNKETILYGNYVDSGELMMRSDVVDLVGYFDERLNTVEDWDMIIRILYETKGIGVLDKYLTQYRFHPERRMPKTLEFNDANHKIIHSKRHGGIFKVACLYPDADMLTFSQRQVCSGITDTIPQLPFAGSYTIGTVKHHDPEAVASSDILLVPAPFQIDPEQMERLASYKVPIVTIHMEDPQAVSKNEKCDKFAKWVVANDVAATEHYQKIVDPKKVLFCPSLSVSLPVFCTNNKWPKEYDVVVCGHAYPSRLKYMNEFLQKMPNLNIFFVGDEWEKLSVPAAHCPTQDEVTTMEIYHAAKIIVCLHRTDEDCGGFPAMPPQSIQRGYVEAFSGALVMIDDVRKQHSFGKDEVVFFGYSDDLKEKVTHFLANPEEAEEFTARAKARATRDFSFKSRLTKVINCVRSERYEMVIP